MRIFVVLTAPLHLINALRAGWVRFIPHGVATLDLTATLANMPTERYYHTDTHWNEAGANAAARAVENALVALKMGYELAGQCGDAEPGADRAIRRSGASGRAGRFAWFLAPQG